MTDAELDHLQSLCDAASPSPWRSCGAQPEAACPCRLVWSVPLDNAILTSSIMEAPGGASAGRAEDLVFVAEARTAVPALIAEVKLQRYRSDQCIAGAAVMAKFLDAKIAKLRAALTEACDLVQQQTGNLTKPFRRASELHRIADDA